MIPNPNMLWNCSLRMEHWLHWIFISPSDLASSVSIWIRSVFRSSKHSEANMKHVCSEYHLNWKSKINSITYWKQRQNVYSGTLWFECLFIKIRSLLMSQCDTIIMGPKKWIEINTSLQITWEEKYLYIQNTN